MVFAHFWFFLGMERNLHELSTSELNNLFLQESTKFLTLLNEKPDSEDLQLIKMKVRLIMDILDGKKVSAPLGDHRD